jgi:hypothetical protein
MNVISDEQGQITLPIAPGTRSGPVVVELTDLSFSQDLHLSLVANSRPPLVVGFATVGAGPVPGWIESPDNAPNGTLARRGTVSIFAVGDVARNTRGTFAYDTADVLQPSTVIGPFVVNPNDRPFPIYGDTSTRYDDALSRNHLYARLDNGRSSATYGLFYATAASGDIAGGYSVLVNGARLHAEGNALGVTAFAARNNIAYDRRVIAPTGLAIANQTLFPDIVVGSDILTLIVLDRRTGAIVSSQLLGRGTDYVLDYASGLLRFINVLLPYDAQFNPQIVTVQYEYGGPGAHSSVTGASGSLKLGPNGGSRADAWWLNNASGGGTGNLSLFGEALSGAAGSGTWSLSHEHSNGFVPISQITYGDRGDSYLVTANEQFGPFGLQLRYNNTTAGYNNPYGAYATPGLISTDLTLSARVSRISQVDFYYLGARNQLPVTPLTPAVNNSDESVGLRLRVRPSQRLQYHVALQSDAANSNGVFNPAFLFSGNSALPTSPISLGIPPFVSPVAYIAGSGHAINLDYGLAWKFAPHAAVLLDRTTRLSNSFDPYAPQQTLAELDLDVGNQGKAFIRQLWQDASIQAVAGSQGAQTYAATASSSTQLGFDQQIGNATIESGYSVDHTGIGTDLYDAIGVRERIASGPRLTGDAFAQVGQTLLTTFAPAAPGTSPFFVALGASLSYSENTFHATGQAQLRTGYNAGTTFQFGAVGPISPAVSLFGSYTGSYTDFVIDSEGLFGLSYRPTQSDRYVTLVSLDSQHSNLTNYDAYVTNVAQVQELYRPSTRTEFAGSLAYKLNGDAYFLPHTTIYGLAADQRMGPRFDLATELHESNIRPLNGASATGFALEAGYRVGDQIRVAAGYNFSGFADPSTAESPTHRGLYVTLSSYIDRIFGWGKEPRTP